MKVIPTLKRQGQGIILISLLGLVSISTLLQWNTKKLSKINLVENGLKTCFTRFSQSFTARLILDNNSPYLEKGFKNLTEECFGEALSSLEQLDFAKLGTGVQTLNQLNLEVYQLHRKLAPRAQELIEETPDSVIVSNLSGRFEKAELKKEMVLEQLQETVSGVTSLRKALLVTFGLFAFLCPILILLDTRSRFIYEKKLAKIRKRSLDLLEQDRFSITKTETLLGDALKEVKLFEVFKLFEAYRTRAAERQYQKPKKKKNDTRGKATFVVPSTNTNELIDQLWSDDDKLTGAPAEDKKVIATNIQESINQVIEGLSTKFLNGGISVNLNINKAYCSLKTEDFNQTFYYAILGILNGSGNSKERKLDITQKRLGNSIIFNIDYSGGQFTSAELETFTTESRVEKGLIELAICQELISDFDGEFKMDNTQWGRRIQLSFTAISAPKLVNIRKTTKREWKKSAHA